MRINDAKPIPKRIDFCFVPLNRKYANVPNKKDKKDDLEKATVNPIIFKMSEPQNKNVCFGVFFIFSEIKKYIENTAKTEHTKPNIPESFQKLPARIIVTPFDIVV